jgi:glutamine amidotransferase
VGNVRSVVRAIERAVEMAGRACDVMVTKDRAVVGDAAFVVVPGQGAFGAFARGIEGGLGDALREHIERGRPYLGICLGMQVLFDASEEAPGAAGLGVLRGRVERLVPGIDPETSRPYSLPHIGWNAVESGPAPSDAALHHFYFAHTYAARPDDAAVIAGTTQYGATRFTSVVAQGAILGVQFHPEKSQREGLELLARFFRV